MQTFATLNILTYTWIPLYDGETVYVGIRFKIAPIAVYWKQHFWWSNIPFLKIPPKTVLHQKMFFSVSISQKDKKKTDKNTKILNGILITKRSHKYKEILRHKMDKNLLHQTILSCGAANFCAPNLIIIIRFYATGSAVI